MKLVIHVVSNAVVYATTLGYLGLGITKVVAAVVVTALALILGYNDKLAIFVGGLLSIVAFGVWCGVLPTIDHWQELLFQ